MKVHLAVAILAALPAAAQTGFDVQDRIPVWQIRIDPEYLQDLEEHPEHDVYYPCTIRRDDGPVIAAEMKVRGQSSSAGDKKSWKVKITDGSTVDRRKKFYWNGMSSHPGPFNDNWAYAVARAAGVKAPRYTYMDLWINGAFHGLYGDQWDSSDKESLRQWGFHDNSNVYRARPMNLSDYYRPTEEWKKETNESTPWDDLEAYLRYVNRTPQDRFESVTPQVIDLETEIDLLAWHAIYGHYVISDCGYYYVHDRTTDRWFTVPHDANNARAWTGYSPQTTLVPHTIYEHYRGLAEREDMWSGLWVRMLDVPSFRHRLVARIQELYATVLTDGALVACLDQLHELALPSLRRDPFLTEPVWEVEYRSLREFISARHRFVLESLRGLETLGDEGIHVNEFLARNNGVVGDEFGEADPFVEIHNATDRAVSLAGMILSGRRGTAFWGDMVAWTLPEGVSVPAHGYLVIWVDGQPEQGPLHAGFRLDPDRGEIGLFRDVPYQGAVNGPHGVVDHVFYGPTTRDRSTGRIADGAESWWSDLVPSPGRPN